MSLYLALKYVHVTCVVISGIGFLARGCWLLAVPARQRGRWLRIAPHVVDSLLLASALCLAVLSGQYPFVSAWLTGKLFGLIAYIGLGSVALRHGRTRSRRIAAFLLALLAFAYIVSVALTRNPLGFLGVIR